MLSKLFPKQLFTLLCSAVALLLNTVVFGQLVVEPDTTICNGGTATLTATMTVSGTGGGISFNNLSTVSLTDDSYTAAINVGFPFTFYGNAYTQCVIASNNYISFDLTNASGYSPWSINSAIPNPGVPTNTIMCPWQDINPGNGGVIEYGTVGTAPNRIFVVRYLGVPMFGCTSLEFCSAIFLFEGTNRIETHIANKPLCTSWNGGVAIHGLHNSTGTIADVVPGRNYPTQWTTVDDGYEFVPNGAAAYNINQIPFQPVISNNNTINWYAGPAPGTFAGTGTSISVSPTSSTTYWAEVQSICGAGAGGGTALIDSATVTVVNGTAPTLTITDPTCQNSTDGSIQIDPNGPNSPWDYDLQLGGGSVGTITGTIGTDFFNSLGAGNYTLTQTESNGCISNMNVVLTDPDSVRIDVIPDTLICIGGAATLSATGLNGNGGPYTLVWDSGLIGNGPHTVNPVVTTCYEVYAIDVNGCISETKTVCVDVNPPMSVTASGSDSICPGGSATLSATPVGGSGNGYTYVWDDGNGNSFTGQVITVTPSQNTTYCVTLLDDCETPSASVCHTVSIRPLPLISFTSDISEGCYPANVNFLNTTAPNQVGSVLWSFGDGGNSTDVLNTNYSYLAPGCFDVSLLVTSPAGCVNQKTVPAMVCARDYPIAEFDANPNPTTIFDPLVQFTNLSVDNVQNDWDFAGFEGSTEVDPKYEFPGNGPGDYPVTLIVTNQFGCTDTIVHTVVVQDEFLLFAPNAFTPNGDGLNDIFYFQGGNIDLAHFQLYIFDRWGNVVFETTDPTKGWDASYAGSQVESGVYVWRVKARSATQGDRYEFHGHVTVVR